MALCSESHPTGPPVGDAGGVPTEAMEPLTMADGGLQAPHSSLELIWPYLLLPPLFRPSLFRRSLRRLYRRRLWSQWVRTLEHPLGDLWPVPAALLPPFIAFAKEGSPSGTQRVSVAGLLLAIAVIQIYGQLRSQRYRKLADARIGRISTGVDRIGSGVEEQGAQLGRLAAYLADKEEEETGS